MRKKRFFKSILMIVLIVLLGVSITVQATSKKDKAQNTTLSEAQKEMEALKSQLKDAKGLISDLKESKGDVESNLSKLNKSLIEISAKVTALEKQLTAKNAQIAETKVKLEAAKADADKQYADMKVRIQYMYENGQFTYVEALLASEDVSEFLNSAEYISQIQEYDRQKLEDYKAVVAEIERFEAQLEQERTELASLKSSVEKEKQNVAALVSQKEIELANLKSEISDAQADANYIAAEVQAQEELIAEIIRIEAEKKAAAQKQETAYSGGFVWPCPSSKRVTSDYGPRKSPTAGASSNHKGIDIGAKSGSDIVAAAPGKVIVSRYSSSAGYYITIDHGGGLYTVYMHCSKLLAAYGETVKAGQVIAKVGSTGVSTGPHLHFGVSLNGNYVSPWGYLSKP